MWLRMCESIRIRAFEILVGVLVVELETCVLTCSSSAICLQNPDWAERMEYGAKVIIRVGLCVCLKGVVGGSRAGD